MKKKTVLLLGSYGHSNLGDDLLMWNYLELLRDKGVATIYVNANTTEHIPKVIKEKYPKLKVFSTYETSLIGYAKIIKNVDYVLYGGGTLYKELYASTGRSPYSVIIRLMGINCMAKLLGTKLYHLNIGIGSLKTWRGKFITKQALQAATFTLFRDQTSYDIASTLGVSPSKMASSTDGLFLNTIWRTIWHDLPLRINRKKYSRIVGINVLSDIPDWVDREKYIAVMRSFIQYLQKQNVYIVFIPFQTAFNPRNDLTFIKENFEDLAKKSGTIVKDISIDTIVSTLRQCDLFVGMRFHSLLLSTVSHVPFLAVAYDTKCWRYVEEIDYPYAIKIEDITLESLIEIYERSNHDQTAIKSKLQQVSDTLYQQAEEDIRNLPL